MLICIIKAKSKLRYKKKTDTNLNKYLFISDLFLKTNNENITHNKLNGNNAQTRYNT